MRRITPLTIIGALLGAGAAMAQTAFAPAAIVNDDPITYYEIEQRALILDALLKLEEAAKITEFPV